MLSVRDQIISYAQMSVEFQTNALLQSVLEVVDTSKQNILWHLYRLVEQGLLLRVAIFPSPQRKGCPYLSIVEGAIPLTFFMCL